MLGKEKSEVLRFQIRSKDVLAPDEAELYELTQLASITMDPSIFKIVLDLLKMNVAPMALMQMLKLMCDPQLQRSAGAAQVHSFLSTSSDSMGLPHNTSLRSTSGSSRPQRPTTSSGSSKSRSNLSSARLRDGRH